MRALIMAAGKGTRISRHIGGRPKCTLNMGDGLTLIEDTVAKLRDGGISEIALVLGYQADVIEDLLADKGVTFFHNPFFDVTNSIASAWFAVDFISDDDILILNGDVFFEASVLDLALATTLNPVLFSDETRKEEADYKLYYEDGRLLKYGKGLQGDDITGEYIGIARINTDLLPLFRKRLEALVSAQKHNCWWEDVLYSLSQEIRINVKDIGGLFWGEVDYIEDYNRIIQYKSLTNNTRISSMGR